MHNRSLHYTPTPRSNPEEDSPPVASYKPDAPPRDQSLIKWVSTLPEIDLTARSESPSNLDLRTLKVQEVQGDPKTKINSCEVSVNWIGNVLDLKPAGSSGDHTI